MKLYNTLTRAIEELEALAPPTITIYTCGPTVYDYPHIGNWFTYIREDTLIRTLQASGFQPRWVMNITDVGHLVSDADDGEDKLEKGAKREGKTAWDVATFYTDYFLQGLSRLGTLRPNELPRATDHIPEQIALIQTLESKGYTYVISDGVYYDTSKFPHYADFARLDLDEQQAGARVEYNTEKRGPHDFALWKFSPKDQKRDMEWDSPWGKGFPGWHIECSAMSMKYLGDTLDIHAGGIDHIPVHHTNEIAQSEAATGKQFARYWMHTNHITVDGDKISKSLGNSITLEDIEAKGISLKAFRLHVLESHYRSQSKFTWESLEAAQNRLRHWQEVADQRWQVPMPTARLDGSAQSQAAFDSHTTQLDPQAISDQRQVVLTALRNDLDTPKALAAIDQAFSFVEQHGLTAEYASDFLGLLETIRAYLGIDLWGDALNNPQFALFEQREAARANKDWAESDRLRDELNKQGIGIRDTAHGSVWYRM